MRRRVATDWWVLAGEVDPALVDARDERRAREQAREHRAPEELCQLSAFLPLRPFSDSAGFPLT